jgi:hypothetical protein
MDARYPERRRKECGRCEQDEAGRRQAGRMGRVFTIAVRGYHGLYIEFKFGKGRLTPEQKGLADT